MTMVCLLTFVLWASSENVDPTPMKFEFIGNTSLVVIPIFVNGQGPYRFLLDTGASHSILSAALAKKLDIRNGRTENLITAGGAIAVSIRGLEVLQVGTLRIHRPQIAVGDFGLLSTLHVDGILGGDFLKSFNVFIDYSRQLVRFGQ